MRNAAGGGGVLSTLGPIQKAWGGGGGGAVRCFRPDTKSRGGGSCLAGKGAVPYTKGGVAALNPPPPPPGSASGLM